MVKFAIRAVLSGRDMDLSLEFALHVVGELPSVPLLVVKADARVWGYTLFCKDVT